MTYRHLTDLADASRKSGLRVVEIDGWQTRGRPSSTGEFDPSGVLCHHTGGAADGKAYAVWLAKDGRSDLPPPLAHLSLDREGTVYVLAAGRANHAGVAKASGPMPKGDGNAIYVGIEAQNTGTEGWSHKATTAAGEAITQREAYALLCAALCSHYSWPATHVRAHRETSVTGKWDPGLLDMDKHRARVADLMNGVEDVAAADVWDETLASAGGRHAGVALGQARSAAIAAAADAAATRALVEQMAKAAGQITDAQLDQIKQAIADAVVKVDVSVKGADA